MQDFLIDGIWILKSDSGLCLFEENYVDFKKDGISRDLATGLLSAIMNFVEDVFIDKLDFINFSSHRIVFKFSPHVLFAVAFSSHVLKNPDIEVHLKECIDKIEQIFNQKYASAFENTRWDGNVDRFASFSEDLQKIVNRKPLDVKLLQLKRTRRKRRRKLDRRNRRWKEVDRFSQEI